MNRIESLVSLEQQFIADSKVHGRPSHSAFHGGLASNRLDHFPQENSLLPMKAGLLRGRLDYMDKTR